MAYYRLIEKNDWEGETWYFYVGLNKEQYKEFLNLLKAVKAQWDGDTCYDLSKKTFTKKEIDKLIEEGGDTGYFHKHNFCGNLTKKLPMVKEFKDDDPFYKGGIRKFCQ